jgi:hypothetical protein
MKTLIQQTGDEMIGLQRGCIVKMKPGTCIGYGNEQCISWVSEPLGEIGLFGHNEACKTYDVQEVISYPHDEAIKVIRSIVKRKTGDDDFDDPREMLAEEIIEELLEPEDKND